jgi:transcriptional regulator with XRE-family HTH domain
MSTATPWRALGAQLAAARHRTAYTQQQLAHQLGLSQAAYSQFERGVLRPRPARLGQLALALGADIAHLATLAGYSLAHVLAATTPLSRTATTGAFVDPIHPRGGAPHSYRSPSH